MTRACAKSMIVNISSRFIVLVCSKLPVSVRLSSSEHNITGAQLLKLNPSALGEANYRLGMAYTILNTAQLLVHDFKTANYWPCQ